VLHCIAKFRLFSSSVQFCFWNTAVRLHDVINYIEEGLKVKVGILEFFVSCT